MAAVTAGGERSGGGRGENRSGGARTAGRANHAENRAVHAARPPPHDQAEAPGASANARAAASARTRSAARSEKRARTRDSGKRASRGRHARSVCVRTAHEGPGRREASPRERRRASTERTAQRQPGEKRPDSCGRSQPRRCKRAGAPAARQSPARAATPAARRKRGFGERARIPAQAAAPVETARPAVGAIMQAVPTHPRATGARFLCGSPYCRVLSAAHSSLSLELPSCARRDAQVAAASELRPHGLLRAFFDRATSRWPPVRDGSRFARPSRCISSGVVEQALRHAANSCSGDRLRHASSRS